MLNLPVIWWMPGTRETMRKLAIETDRIVMRRLVTSILWAIMLISPAMADGPWSGDWTIKWANGAAGLTLAQDGSTVSGSYRTGHGHVEATAHGTQLDGFLIDLGEREGFTATMAPDSKSFSGHTNAGNWLLGIRVDGNDALETRIRLDLSNPRAAFKSFLNASNRARDGESSAAVLAVDAVDFSEQSDWTTRDDQSTVVSKLFKLIDSTIVQLADIPEDAKTSEINVALDPAQADGGIHIEIKRSANGDWLIVMPSETDLTSMETALHAVAGTEPVAEDSFRQLSSPRDTMRSFLEGMSRWRTGGNEQAVGTLDLSNIPDLMKTEQGELLSQYLIRVLDRIGYIPLQSIPNDGASREPFVYFEHPSGSIVISPVGTGADTKWKFTSETVDGLRHLFQSVQELPPSHTLSGVLIPHSATFAIRDLVQKYVPFLLTEGHGALHLEYWQVVGGILNLVLTAMMFLMLRPPIRWLFTKLDFIRHLSSPGRVVNLASIVIAFILCGKLVPLWGLPVTWRQYSTPFIGTLIVAVLVYLGWQLITLVSSIAEEYMLKASRNPDGAQVDPIIVTFTSGLLRVALIIGTGLLVSYLWSFSTTGLLASFGIGGLALAFASKETLENVFGAGILMGDRPFKKGDRIVSEGVSGLVEAVGLRSTRIQTPDGSLLVVPNGKLADTAIENLGGRRHINFSTSFTLTPDSAREHFASFSEAVFKRLESSLTFKVKDTELNIVGISTGGVQVELAANLQALNGGSKRDAINLLFLDVLQVAASQGIEFGYDVSATS